MAAESPAADHLPFQTTQLRIGQSGVNLSKPLDDLDPGELARLTNARGGSGTGVETRPGLTALATAGSTIHSISRMNDPGQSGFNRFWGVDTSWGRGASGGISILEGGFSGNPLSMVPWENEFGQTLRMYVADSNKMRKAGLAATGSVPIGLPKAAQPASITPAPVEKTQIATFSAADGTQASAWSTIADATNGGAGAGKPTVVDIVGPSGGGVSLGTVPGTSTEGYTSVASMPLERNLANVGAVVADDEDLIHIWLRMDNPTAVEEIRVYLICSPYAGGLFSTIIPGQSSLYNTSAYMHAFRPSDYAGFISGAQTGVDAAAIVRANDLLRGYSDPRVTGSVNLPSAPGLAGVNAWSEYGIIGVPLRRSDFTKIGNAGGTGVSPEPGDRGPGTPGTDWSTITGITLVVITNSPDPVNVGFDDLFQTGGGEPDTSEPDAQPYDYRIVNYDTINGTRSNPSDVLTTTIDVARQKVLIQPVAYGGQSGIVQEAYRRGGTLTDDWFGPVAVNTSDGGLLTDNTPDPEAFGAGPVFVDHDQPITTVSTSGSAIYNQAVPILFGPIDGYLFALGDPNRPGHLYWCKRNEPDHWPSSNHLSVCAASDELMTGGVYGAQAFCFSRERMYSILINLTGGDVNTQPTDCDKGPVSRWAMAIGLGGIYLVSRDSVYATSGGPAKDIAEALRPLFQGKSANGYNPIDFSQSSRIRLALNGSDLWFGFQDTSGNRVWWVYSFLYQQWSFTQFAMATAVVYSEPITNNRTQLLVGGAGTGKAYTHTGLTDDGSAIACSLRTGAEAFGRLREEKLLGDVFVKGVLYGSTLTMTGYLNSEKTANTSVSISGTSSVYDRYLLDPFGTVPQHAERLSIDLAWTGSPLGSPTIKILAVDVAIQPAVTMNRATTWEPLNNKGENYLIGCWIDCDTGGSPRTILVEGLLSGQAIAITTLSVNSNHGRRLWFSWPAVHVDMVRLRPTGACEPWMLFGCGWLAADEPPRIAGWDSGFENLGGDRYHTGLDIECDTFGQTKTIEVSVDNVVVGTYPLLASGHSYKHITLPWGRGHIYRFRATDSNVGLLYQHKWITDPEPGEQTNWNQNYTLAGTLADKWLKGILLECDTFGLPKSVTVEVDGVVVATPVVTTSNRKVVQVAFPQALGRVFRIYPTDGNPGRLYSHGWLFDQEPYQLTRFETQEQRHGLNEWHMPQWAQIAIKSTDTIMLTLTTYGQNGVALTTSVYMITSTGGIKAMCYVPFVAQKGVLTKYLFTSPAGFWLYREESSVVVAGWPSGSVGKQHPFGNDDLDAAREMVSADLAASRSGGAGA